MSVNSREDHFFIYGRFEDGTYSGHTYCVILRNGRMFHGEALCSTSDQFSKREGRIISFERAMLEYERYCRHIGEESESWNNPYIKDEPNE